jgi:hypothetical protein
MPVADHIPQDVRDAAEAALVSAAGLNLSRAWDRVRLVVPERYCVELIESPGGRRRIYWPRFRQPGQLFAAPPLRPPRDDAG